MRYRVAPAVLAVLIGCGMSACSSSSDSSGNPGGPSSGGTTCSSVSVLGSARGSINATISGATFNGGIPNGNAVYTPIPPTLGLAAQDFFVISGVCGDNSQMVLTVRAGSFQNGVFVLGAPGTTQFGVDASGNPLRDPQTQQPLTHSATYTLVQNAAAAGAWVTSLVGGSGSITLTTVSTRAASGSFALTMVPSGGATGNKTVTGTFNATFP